MKFTTPLTLKQDANCCQGHFPGNPIVPGAYLLSLVAQAVNQQLPKHRLQSVGKVKFVAALAPGEQASMELETNDEVNLRFTIMRDQQTIISGTGTLCPRD